MLNMNPIVHQICDKDEASTRNFRRSCKADGNPEGAFSPVPEVDQAQPNLSPFIGVSWSINL